MSGYTPSVVDVGGPQSPLWAYEFAGVGADATLTGYFTDSSGRQASPAVTITAPTADGTVSANFFDDAEEVVSGDPYDPDDSVDGFYGVLSGADVYMGLGRTSAGGRVTAFSTEAPQSGYPVVVQADFIAFGRTS